ncbi:MAG: DNA/RNA nuclease SfsA [Deferribacterota bacterium]|nr:DNA/RNA nuclease SfsA [Deferribacterota bacterium]
MKNIIEATFIERINRFVVKCEYKGEIIYAYLANPGRLWELLVEGRKVLLKYQDKDSRKYKFSCFSIVDSSHLILLDTHYNNVVAEKLINNNMIEELKDYNIESKECSFGKSRFDFLLKCGNKRLILEVKSSTLYYDKLAMFPDAPSKRATKHIYELARLAGNGCKTAILFLAYSPNVKYFLPEFNVDIDFAHAFYDSRERILFFAYTVNNFSMFPNKLDISKIGIPLELLKDRIVDKGSYLLVLKLNVEGEILIGKLGEIFFKKGYYVYIGSAMNSLTKRINRHKRKRKNKHWHIDYFIEYAKFLKSFAIRETRRYECSLASRVKKIAKGEINNFGSSDCSCTSHLFYFKENPLHNKMFIDIILYYRMGKIVELLN